MNQHAFRKMFLATMEEGRNVAPRGLKILELEDYQLTVSPKHPFMGFAARKYDVGYFKKEMIWKLSANKHDESIKAHAKMWESVQNPDGTFNSNYGQYWFGEQMGFWIAVLDLIKSPDSRRAVIPMLQPEHLSPHTTDTVCTESVGLRIRNNRLNMSVHMRSSDQVFGLGTDIPTFSFLYRLAYAILKDVYPDLDIGKICITAMSSHVYERHFGMVNEILNEPGDTYVSHGMPWCATGAEAMRIIASRGKDLNGLGSLADWLVS